MLCTFCTIIIQTDCINLREQKKSSQRKWLNGWLDERTVVVSVVWSPGRSNGIQNRWYILTEARIVSIWCSVQILYVERLSKLASAGNNSVDRASNECVKHMCLHLFIEFAYSNEMKNQTHLCVLIFHLQQNSTANYTCFAMFNT